MNKWYNEAEKIAPVSIGKVNYETVSELTNSIYTSTIFSPESIIFFMTGPIMNESLVTGSFKVHVKIFNKSQNHFKFLNAM